MTRPISDTDSAAAVDTADLLAVFPRRTSPSVTPGPPVSQAVADVVSAVIPAERRLPALPAAGQRDNKIPKFSGDVLGWEADAGGGALAFGRVEVNPGRIVNAADLDGTYQCIVSLTDAEVSRLSGAGVNYLEIWFGTETVHVVSPWAPALATRIDAVVDTSEESQIGAPGAVLPVRAVYRINAGGGQTYYGEGAGALRVGGHQDVNLAETINSVVSVSPGFVDKNNVPTFFRVTVVNRRDAFPTATKIRATLAGVASLPVAYRPSAQFHTLHFQVVTAVQTAIALLATGNATTLLVELLNDADQVVAQAEPLSLQVVEGATGGGEGGGGTDTTARALAAANAERIEAVAQAGAAAVNNASDIGYQTIGDRAGLVNFLTTQASSPKPTLVLFTAALDETVNSIRYNVPARQVRYFKGNNTTGRNFFVLPADGGGGSGQTADQVQAAIAAALPPFADIRLLPEALPGSAMPDDFYVELSDKLISRTIDGLTLTIQGQTFRPHASTPISGFDTEAQALVRFDISAQSDTIANGINASDRTLFVDLTFSFTAGNDYRRRITLPVNNPIAPRLVPEALDTIPFNAALTLDWLADDMRSVTLTANVTFTFSNIQVGRPLVLEVKQDATGGRSITWPSSVEWAGGSAEGPSSGGGDVDIFTLLPLSKARVLAVALLDVS